MNAFHDGVCLEDRRLAESIARALHATGHRSLGEVQVTARAGSITLAGQVPSFYLKQFAQEIARQVGGALEVHNQIHVIRACQPGVSR
jgi:osmotically-inducible protein OsmY